MKLYGFLLGGNGGGRAIEYQVEADSLAAAIAKAELENPGWTVRMGRSLESYPDVIAAWKRDHPEAQVA